MGRKLTALAWNRDPRPIETHRRSRSAGAQSALGKRDASEAVFLPVLHHLADRIARRLREKDRPGRTITVRVRFADMHAVTRARTLPAPICATTAIAEIASELVGGVLRDHPEERTISLLAIAVSHLDEAAELQLELPFRLGDDGLLPGTRKGMARLRADKALDAVRARFGTDAIGYARNTLGFARAVPDAFRSLAEKDL